MLKLSVCHSLGLQALKPMFARFRRAVRVALELILGSRRRNRIFKGRRVNICSAIKASRYSLPLNFWISCSRIEVMFTSATPISQNDFSSLNCRFTVTFRQLTALLDRADQEREFLLGSPVTSEWSVPRTNRRAVHIFLCSLSRHSRIAAAMAISGRIGGGE